MKKKILLTLGVILLSGTMLVGCGKEPSKNLQYPQVESDSEIYEKEVPEEIEVITPYSIVNDDEWSVWFGSTINANSDDGTIDKKSLPYIYLVGKGKVVTLGYQGQHDLLNYGDFSKMPHDELVNYALELAKKQGYDVDVLPNARIIVHTDDSGNKVDYEEIIVSNYDENQRATFSYDGFVITMKDSSVNSPIFDAYFDGFRAWSAGDSTSELWLTKCNDGEKEVFVELDTLDTEGIEIK